jgi:hypothetical protein
VSSSGKKGEEMITDDHIRLALDIEEGDVVAAAQLVQASAPSGRRIRFAPYVDILRIPKETIERYPRLSDEHQGCFRALIPYVEDPFHVTDEELENIALMEDDMQMGMLMSCVDKLRGDVNIDEEQRQFIEAGQVGRLIARRFHIQDRIERENIEQLDPEDVLLMLEEEEF